MPKRNGNGEGIVIDGKDGEMVNKEKMIDVLRAWNQKEKGEKMARNVITSLKVNGSKWETMKQCVYFRL